MARALMIVPLLTLVYALALESFKLWDLAIGALVSAALLAATWGQLFAEHRPVRGSVLRRIIALVPFALAVVRDITSAPGRWPW